MTEPRFDPATSSPDPGTCLPGCLLLRDYIFIHWPEHRGFAGCYLHNGLTDGGTPSFHSRGRAIDIWIGTGYTQTGTDIFNWCYENRNEIGLNEVIFNSRIWRADNLSADIHPYTANRHIDHIHIAINEDGANARLPFYQNTQSPPTPKPVLEDEIIMYVHYHNQLHGFFVSKSKRLIQRLEGADGNVVIYDISAAVGFGPVDPTHAPIAAEALNGDLVVGIYGTDGVFNEARWVGNSKWVPRTYS